MLNASSSHFDPNQSCGAVMLLATALGLPKRGKNAKMRAGSEFIRENLGYVYFLY